MRPRKISYPRRLYIDLFTGKVEKATFFHRFSNVCKRNPQRYRFVGFGFTYTTLQVVDELGLWHVVWSRGNVDKFFEKIYEELKIQTSFKKQYKDYEAHRKSNERPRDPNTGKWTHSSISDNICL